MKINNKSILFLCTNNDVRSQFAEAIAKQYTNSEVAIQSAGIVAAEFHPMAKTTLQDMNISFSGQFSKSIDQLKQKQFNIVVTLCDNTYDNRHVFMGSPAYLHWSLDDSKLIEGDESITKEVFKNTANEIKRLIRALFEDGYATALTEVVATRDRIIDNLSEGVVAHDLNRKIFLFNRTAEKITGLSKGEVLGKDCHEVFFPHLCGENCSFCNVGCSANFSHKEYSTVYINNGSERKNLEVSVVPMVDGDNKQIGVIASFTDKSDVKKLEQQLKAEEKFQGIIGLDHKMQHLYDLIRDLSQCDFSVVITGESGTGKELVAKAIHAESPRKDELFVPINCGALPEGTLESELFGHVRGSFTGAIRDKKGRFELADKGTLFLDEVAELPLSIQVKLLRILQDGAFEPVGSEKTKHVDVRIVSATNKNLKDMIKKGTFREDLFYRLAVIPIEMPPLRERRNDIVLLAKFFLDDVCRKMNREETGFAQSTLSTLMSYSWPGNVRQLQNAIQFTMIKCRDNTILPEHLPPELIGFSSVVIAGNDGDNHTGKVGRKPKLSEDVVIMSLQKAGGNKAKAARILGVGRATLYNFLKENPTISQAVDADF